MKESLRIVGMDPVRSAFDGFDAGYITDAHIHAWMILGDPQAERGIDLFEGEHVSD